MQSPESFTFLLGSEHRCDYLLDQSARSIFLAPDAPIDDQIYSKLAEHGFRRSGGLVYRPHCNRCHACIPLRIPVRDFSPSKNQRKTLKQNSDLTVNDRTAMFDNNHFQLYSHYMKSRHPGGSMAESTAEDYLNFLKNPWGTTRFFEFMLDQRIAAVAVVDYLDDGLSAVYTFFDPDLATRSLGKYAILWQIEYAKRLGLSWLYLGYWIKSCKKMTYKSQYKPAQAYINGTWNLMDE